MLGIYNPLDANDIIPFPVSDDKRYIKHKYDGLDTLTFEIDSNNTLYKYIAEEVKIKDEKNRYVIKNIDEHSDFATVMCSIDLDDWKQDIFPEFRTTNKLLDDVMAMIIPEGWMVVGTELFTKRTTVEGNEGEPLKAVTRLDILDAVSESYGCVFNFDVLNQIVTAIDPTSYKVSGEFFTDELNLKNLGFVGNSESFATRLYAYGAKDENGVSMTFADINDGKEYVEDYTYSDKIISVGWSDERYTVKEDLLKDAKIKLAELSYPSRSYTCDAKNLNDDVWMYKIVTLIDRRRNTRVNHQIVEYKEYPNHILDSVTLSKTAPRIETEIKKVESLLTDKIDIEKTKMQKLLEQTVDYATDKITGNKGGHFVWIFDEDGKPIELVNLGDTEDINTAQKVWRWNAAGLGHSNDGYNGAYTLALLDDGSINASAILTGILTANLIRSGRIADLADKNYWDLETGEFHLSIDTSVDSKDAPTVGELIKKMVDISVTSEGIKTEVSSVKKEVEELDVGSRNLLRNSKTLIFDSYGLASGEGINYLTDESGNILTDEMGNLLIL